MAGSGYDVSTSTARSLGSGAQGTSDTFITFGNSSASRGASSQDLTVKNNASASTGSPGANNQFSDLPVAGQYGLQQGIQTTGRGNGMMLILIAIGVILIFKK